MKYGALTAIILAAMASCTVAIGAEPMPLGRVKPLRSDHVSWTHVQETYDAFPHGPIDTGFYAIALPFRSSGGDPKTTGNEAQAMAFLLSDALDWGPGNYSARHAFFVFKRSGDAIKSFTTSYDPKAIARHIENWGASHAIGGQLVKSSAGYGGTLEIYDRKAKRVLTRRYEKHRPFFELLGDMSVDAITHLDQPPSDGLAKLLREPRCEHHESLALLGSAAFPAQSYGELPIFEQVLKRDPGFSEARHWWTLQRYWKTREAAPQQQELERLMVGRPNVMSIWEVDVSEKTDRRVVEAIEAHRKRLGEMLPFEAPVLARLDYLLASARGTVNADLVDRCGRSLARYPNAHLLGHQLATFYIDEAGGVDLELAASVRLLGIRDRYLPGIGKAHDYVNLADLTPFVGRPDIAVWLIEKLDEDDMTPQAHRVYATALFHCGEFARMVNHVEAHPKEVQPSAGETAFFAIVAAAMVNDRPAFDRLIKRYGEPRPVRRAACTTACAS